MTTACATGDWGGQSLPNGTDLIMRSDQAVLPIQVSGDARNPSKSLEWAARRPWMLHEPVLQSLMSVLARHAEGRAISEVELKQIVASRDERRAQARAERDPADAVDGLQVLDGGIAVIPIQGVIAKYSSQVNQVSQPRGTSTEALTTLVRQAMASSEVRALLLDIESPGGSVSGVDELAAELREARETKPVYALADGMAASAAYYFASQATEIAATRGSLVGSIGVYTPVVDSSDNAAEFGVKVHLVRFGAAKGIGVPGVPISDADLKEVQREVDAFGQLFVDSVAEGRRMDRDKALKLADGRIHLGGDARKLGLIDHVMTFDRFVAHIRDELDSSEAEVTEESIAAVGAGEGAPAAHTNVGAGGVSANLQQRDEDMTEKSVTSPAPATQSVDLDAVRAEAAAEAQAKERERIQEIRGAAVAGQDKLADKLIEGGASAFDALKELHADLKGRYESVEAAQKRDPIGALPTEEQIDDTSVVVEGESAPAATATKADPLMQEWNGSRSLQSEFQDFDTFKAYREGKARASRRPAFLRGGA